MHQTSQQSHNANEAGIQAFERFAGIAFAGAERLAALNLNTARNLLEQGAATSRALLEAKNPEALVTLQTRLSRTDTREAAEYSRRVVEIASQTGATVSKLVESGVTELRHSLDQALDRAADKAPAGADLALNSLRSAVTAANAAFDRMNLAARQANEVAEANLAVLAKMLAGSTQTPPRVR